MPARPVVWRDPQRPIWGNDWPYYVTPQIGGAVNSGPPPGSRIPVIWDDVQRPIRGVQWQYGYTIRSQSTPVGPGTPVAPGLGQPPGSPWGNTGAAAPELEFWGYYAPWPAQHAGNIASTITPPFVPGAPPPTSNAQLFSIINGWVTDWGTRTNVQIATLVPPPPPTNPPPQSRVNLYLTRLAWTEPQWSAQTGGFIGDLPQPPPIPPQPPPNMPDLSGLLLWEGIAALEAAGVLVPASLGYFTEFPVSVVWVPITITLEQLLTNQGFVIFPDKPGPGLIVAQSIAPGLHVAPNSPVTLTCFDYPTAVIFP